jgi:L-asparaginase/Glu-tRNA(Gln) amidotransferase subunit D
MVRRLKPAKLAVHFHQLRAVDSKKIDHKYHAHFRRLIASNRSSCTIVITGTDRIVQIASRIENLFAIHHELKNHLVVVLGSMLPATQPGSDAQGNLQLALRLVEQHLLRPRPGVAIVLSKPERRHGRTTMVATEYRDPAQLRKVRKPRGRPDLWHLQRRPTALAKPSTVHAALAA